MVGTVCIQMKWNDEAIADVESFGGFGRLIIG
jgi:hypothetical protein